MFDATPGNWFWGPRSRIGYLFAVLSLAADQAHKWWMIHIYGIEEKSPVTAAPFLDLVMVWNQGISYGLLSGAGKPLLVGFAVVAVLLMAVWMARTHDALVAISIGLIMGGAIGNAIDRIVYGAVADFFSFHVGDFYWYVFNIADATIVAGVIGLLWESLFGGHKKVSNAS